MSKQQEALRLALEALEKVNASVHLEDYYNAFDEEITAIKEALAQPEQEPVACIHRIVDVTNEVVKSGYMCVDCGAVFRSYTTPPQRTWQGLTDKEQGEIALEVPIDAVLITEAKLKEKNG